MHFLFIALLLPVINAIVIAKIHQSAIYHPVSLCAFLRNTSLPTDASSQSCIWECVYENDCQTAVYFDDEKICSMFAESCKSDGIQASGSIQASVICYRNNHESSVTCSSTVTTDQTEVEKTTVSTMAPSATQDPMCTPFWKMPSSDQGTYLTYFNANTLISGDHSRSVCVSFNASTVNADNIVFAIGSSLTTWNAYAGCNTHFALSVKNASHVNVYSMCPVYDDIDIPVGQSILNDGTFHQICVTYDNTSAQLCVYLDSLPSNCHIRTNVRYNTGLGDVRIGWWPDGNFQFNPSGGGLIQSASLFDRAINQTCVAHQVQVNNIG